MSGRLRGKRVLIYGGGTGIGLGCARRMLQEGAGVFISGRRTEVLKEASIGLEKYGSVGFNSGDAAIPEDVDRTTKACVEFLGGLDTIVVSAGTGGRTSIFDTEPEEFQRIIDQNLRPLFLAVRFAAPHLVSAGSASVVAVSSMYGLVGQIERFAYCAAKAGVNGMVKAMALDFAGKGVRVNAICPGFIETELARAVARQEPDPEAALDMRRKMHPIPRSGQPDEVGEAAVYLASEASSFMTGQAIVLDGGYTAR